MNILINTIRLITCLIEPYMPSYSAKVYEIANIKYDEKNSTLLRDIVNNDWKYLLDLIPAGHTINEPKPLFKESKYNSLCLVTEEQTKHFKNKYG